MKETILQACDLRYHYEDGTCALEDLNIQIKRGKKTAIIGGNGAGKSTLFLNFNGVLRPKEGHILYNGEIVQSDKKSINNLRKKVGLVFQEPDHQIFSSSIYQEIAFGPLNFGLSKEEVSSRVEKVMEEMQITHLKEKPTHFLSYGQKKQVAIASILVMEPEVIILDEPTAGLDPMHIKKLLLLLDALSEKGITLIIATHDVNFAYSWADCIHVMQEGQIIRSGSPQEIFMEEQVLEASNMEMPYMVEFMKKYFRGSQLFKEDLPRTIDELVQTVKGGLISGRN
ncbi:MAG: energy-coupling factor ABC transporter ATP-binding protein [Firmicutes bacterium HGW-Firmicutes-1]|nr:MAG: energy-coupling factor ABC transporter ATP-binding protein [Firmicutes bacterium HGW-Firmicutes-1]